MTLDTRRVLVVDDEPDICWALERILKAKGYFPVVAHSGASALALAAEGQFYCALVDAKLPDAEGIEVVRRFRELHPLLPAVLISGYFYSDDASVNGWIKEGLICTFIEKPFRHELVHAALELAGRIGPKYP